jgi:hypothetical protein
MGMRKWGECESEGGGDDGDENEVEVWGPWW